MRRTKIVCTIGPSCSDIDMLTELREAGMNLARLNMSHGDHAFHKRVFDSIRDMPEGKAIPVMFDIQGPKIRVGRLDGPMIVKAGESIEVFPGEGPGSENRLPIDYPKLLEELKVGDEVFINDGTVRIVVARVEGDHLLCTVENGGVISERKGCNIPSSNLSVSVPTDKDLRDLDFISALDPEYIAVSFVNSPDDVERVRDLLIELGAPRVKLVSKIERPLALKNIEGIIEKSDAVMVARGDLGVEIPPEFVPQAQKDIILSCNRGGIPVIVATQMLESMVLNPRPTRAEANDVFNAVLDGADALMLSAETSAGRYPAGSVRFMDRIIRSAESVLQMRDPDYYDSPKGSAVEAAGHAVFTLAKEIVEMQRKGCIIAVTESGFSARMISKYRPVLPIIAMSPDERTSRELDLVWGVRPVRSRDLVHGDIESRAVSALTSARKMGLVGPGESVIMAFTSIECGGAGIYTAIYDVDEVLARCSDGAV
ncbi:MAG: pyruvate kinase [Candidatus Thermoplasmatota archaeon]|nr:pyruvate kinase [Candidatus Thermoplasmatota archaeon]